MVQVDPVLAAVGVALQGGLADLLAGVDLVLVAIIAVLLGIVFAFFLMIRRMVTEFTQGMREGNR